MSWFFKDSVTKNRHYCVIIIIQRHVRQSGHKTNHAKQRIKGANHETSVKIRGSNSYAGTGHFIEPEYRVCHKSVSHPGSEQDPIVSKSYVDAAFEQLSSTIQTLLDKINELNNKVAEQDKTIKALQDEVNALKSGTAAGNVPSGAAGSRNLTNSKPHSRVSSMPRRSTRGKPTTSSRKLGLLYKNETVTILSDEGSGGTGSKHPRVRRDMFCYIRDSKEIVPKRNREAAPA